MSIDAEVGAEVELGGFSLQTLLGMAASLDGIHQSLKKLHNLEEAYQFGAVRVKLANSSTSNAAGNSLEVGLGGPTYGRQWQVRRITIGGSLWTTAVEGSALLVVGPTVSTNPPLTDIADEVASLPSNGFYSTGQLIVRHTDHLRVVILSPTASTVYAVGGVATDMPDKREPIRTEQ